MSARERMSRIWIAVDALDRSADALGAVMRLASGHTVELAGLFVEDSDLVRLAGWPAATEKRLFEPSLRPFGGPEFEAALRAQALALQRRLDALAREIGVSWSFRTARGRVVQQALSLAGSGDWIVLAGASTSVQLRLRQVCAPARPMLWLLPEHPDDLASLLAAAARYDPVRAAQIRPVASAALQRGALRCASVSDLLARAACGPRVAGELVLMTRAAGSADPERLRGLLRRGATPLVLV